MPIDSERRKQLRSKTLEHLEAARACLDESGDGVGNYLVERAIDEVTSQQWAAVCAENVIRIDWLTESPNVSECSHCSASSWPS